MARSGTTYYLHMILHEHRQKNGKKYPIRVCWLVDRGSYSGRAYDIPYLKEIYIVIHELNNMWPTVKTLIYDDLCKHCSLNPGYITQTTRVPASLFGRFYCLPQNLSFKNVAWRDSSPSLWPYYRLAATQEGLCWLSCHNEKGLEIPAVSTPCYPRSAIAWYLVQRSKIWKTQQLPEAWPRSHGASSNTRQHGMRASISRDENLIHKALPYQPNLFPFTIRAVGQTASWTTLQKPPWHVQYLWSSFKNL